MKAVHFGAGNIGRGFIGKILLENGIQVLFVDVSESLVTALNQAEEYRVRIVSEHTDVTEICKPIRAALLSSDETKEAFASASLVTLSVGIKQLVLLAPLLANLLQHRYEVDQLKEACWLELDPTLHDWAEKRIGFVDTAVDRIVLRKQADTKSLDLITEPFAEWIIDQTQLRSSLPHLPYMQRTDQLTAFIKRKLFTLNTGHAITAYLGKQAGKSNILEAIKTPSIEAIVQEAMQESGAVLCQQFPIFSIEDHNRYIQKIIQRFKNPELQDSVLRVGRDVLRKLGAQERLVSPLRSAIQAKLPYHALLQGVAAALHFTTPTDADAIQLQEWIAEKGPTALFQELTGITDPTVEKEFLAAYKQMRSKCALFPPKVV